MATTTSATPTTSRDEIVDTLACCLNEVLLDDEIACMVDLRLIDWMLLQIWWLLGIDVARVRVVRELRGHRSEVNALCVWGNVLISGSNDHTLKLWESSSIECSRTFLGHTDWVRCVVSWGDRLASGSDDSTVKVWRADAEACEMTLTGHHRTVQALAVCGERLCSGSWDHNICVWSRAGNCERVLTGHRGSVWALVVWDGVLYSGSVDQSIRAWNVETGRCEQTIEKAHNKNGVSALGLWRGQLVSGSFDGDGELKLWDRSGRALRSLVGHIEEVLSLQVWEEFLVSASVNGTIRLWSAEGNCVRVLDTRSWQRAHAIWNNQMVVGGEDCVLRMWSDEL